MRRLVLCSLLGLMTTSCVASGADSNGYDLREFEVEGPATLYSGASALRITNSGEFPHTLVVAREDGIVVSATDLLQPGESTQLALDLAPGTYQFTCRIVSQTPAGEIVDHFERGMSETVVVVEA